MESIPRARSRSRFLKTLLIALLFFPPGIKMMVFDTSYKGVPVFVMPILLVIVVGWISAFLWMLLFGLTGLHSVQIDHEELKLCLGPLVLKRIPTDRIKTVGLCAVSAGKTWSIDTYFLVLSEKPPEELNEKGKKALKSKNVLKRMRDSEVTADGPYAAAKAYLFDHCFRELLWIEDSLEVREVLRRYLSGVKYLL